MLLTSDVLLLPLSELPLGDPVLSLALGLRGLVLLAALGGSLAATLLGSKLDQGQSTQHSQFYKSSSPDTQPKADDGRAGGARRAEGEEEGQRLELTDLLILFRRALNVKRVLSLGRHSGDGFRKSPEMCPREKKEQRGTAIVIPAV